MTDTGLLDRSRAALIVVDVQEAFRPGIVGFDELVGRCAVLASGARAIGIPVLVTEQYPQGLGKTVPELAEALDGLERLPKTVFSAAQADGFDLAGRDQAIVCGIEAHVCVAQSALDLLSRGVSAHIAADAVSSRNETDRDRGLARAERAGAVLSTVEMALFELLRGAGGEDFKAVQRLVK